MAMFVIYAKAQLYSSEVHFYIEAGADISNGSTIVEVVKFEGNHVYVKAQSVYKIKEALNSNRNYYDTDVKSMLMFQIMIPLCLQLRELSINIVSIVVVCSHLSPI